MTAGLTSLGASAAAALIFGGAAAASPYADAAQARVAAVDAALVPDCPGKDRIIRAVGGAPLVGPGRAAGREGRGLETLFFLEHFEAAGCGQPPRAHHAVIAARADELTVLVGFPGATRTTALHQIEIMARILAMLAARGDACGAERVRVLDTLVLRDEGSDVVAAIAAGVTGSLVTRAWRETWRVEACENRFDLHALVYADDEGGLGYFIDPPEPAAAP